MKTSQKHRFKLSEKEKEFIKEIGRFLLGFTITGTLLLIVAVAPNSIKLAELFIKKNPKYKNRDEDVRKVFKKMFINKIIQPVEKNGRDYVEITDKGKRELVEFDIDTVKIKKQEWDNKFRVVIFDVPEVKKIAREVLRGKLKEIGFVKIQKSVWASPYECEKEILFITSMYGVEKFVNYMVVEKADFSNYMKEMFNL